MDTSLPMAWTMPRLSSCSGRRRVTSAQGRAPFDRVSTSTGTLLLLGFTGWMALPAFVGSEETSAPVLAAHDPDGAYVASEQFVLKQLKAPATAQFEYGGSRKVVALGGGRYRVTSYVDAQNGFGAMIRQEFHAAVQRTSTGWRLESLRMD